MASTKEIQNRISSVRDTMKITNAMYMMSSMKLRKAKQQLEHTEPYFFGLQDAIADILIHFPTMEHLYFDNRDEDRQQTVRNKGYVIVTGDKGMAGAYNHNVLKQAEALLEGQKDSRLFVVGELGRHYFTHNGYNVDEEFLFSANSPSMHRAHVIMEQLLELYDREELDEIHIIYTNLDRGVAETVKHKRILPLDTQEILRKENPSKSVDGEYALFYPDPKTVLENMVKNYVVGFVYGALVESFASEENARMLAMQSATDNAQAMLDDLRIQFNRVRQAAITQEITEVISGAKALKKKKIKQQQRRKH